MRQEPIDISVIIPQKNSIRYLQKLFSTIPENERIQIIVVDNSEKPVTKEEIGISRSYSLLWASPDRCAGGARNVGIDHAEGRWLVFADADDYFEPGAFDLFLSKVNSTSDLIYYCPRGIFMDTGETSVRGKAGSDLINDYLNGKKSEMDLRLHYLYPYCKMVRTSMVKERNLRFDEVLAGNDMYFSMTSGYYANRVEVVNRVVYVVTSSPGTLTRRFDYDVIKSRLNATLHCNEFLRAHKLGRHQLSIMFALIQSVHFGTDKTLEFLRMAREYRQNPFVGCSRWGMTLLKRIVFKSKSGHIAR